MTHDAHDTPDTPNTPHTASPTTPRSDDAGELRYCGRRLTLRGRVLRLILQLAARQRNINEIAPDAGQMWITWTLMYKTHADAGQRCRRSGVLG